KGKLTDAEGKADDGPLRLVHLSVGNGECALPESTGPTGKRRARKRACSVWSGGKAAKPYLSLPSTTMPLSCPTYWPTKKGWAIVKGCSLQTGLSGCLAAY